MMDAVATLAKNGYHQAAAVSETVSGLTLSVIIDTPMPDSSNLIPVLSPETPAPRMVTI